MIISVALLGFCMIESCSSKPSSQDKSSDSTLMSHQQLQVNDSLNAVAGEVVGSSGSDYIPIDDIRITRNGVISSRPHYIFLGFSNDHQYSGYIEGQVEGAVFKAKLYVMNVDKSYVVIKPVEMQFETQTLEEDMIQMQQAYEPVLLKYKLLNGEKGTSYDIDDQSNVNIPFGNKFYKLKLIEKNARDANKYFELQALTDTDPIILHKDNDVPPSRGKVISYRVVALFLLEDKLAVFVEYGGPDKPDINGDKIYEARFLLVTGTLY